MATKLCTFLLGITCSLSVVFAQDSKFDRSKLTFGGNFALGFADESTIITVLPQIGYNFTPQINLGAGIGYSYHRYKIDGETAKFNYYGMNVYGRFFPASFLVFQVQPEIYYSTRNLFGEKGSGMVPALIVGAGLRMGNVTAMLQYDLIHDDYSPYGTSIFYGVGYMF
ncbi:MAG: hypothetical protein LBE91_01165 [Tannerella sp.]|nr:hypothetical protein [Tannerella sp.]